jgi:hypothetical protein
MFHCEDESSGIQHGVASFKQNDVSEARTASIIRTVTDAVGLRKSETSGSVSTRLHGAITQTTDVFILSAVRT